MSGVPRCSHLVGDETKELRHHPTARKGEGGEQQIGTTSTSERGARAHGTDEMGTSAS